MAGRFCFHSALGTVDTQVEGLEVKEVRGPAHEWDPRLRTATLVIAAEGPGDWFPATMLNNLFTPDPAAIGQLASTMAGVFTAPANRLLCWGIVDKCDKWVNPAWLRWNHRGRLKGEEEPPREITKVSWLCFPLYEGGQGIRMFYIVPTHLDFAEVVGWEHAVHDEPSAVGPYADWLEEHGWPEREAALRQSG
jgi:hypothetical protein